MKKSIITAALVAISFTGAFATDNVENAKDAAVAVQASARPNVYNLVYKSAEVGVVTVIIRNQDDQVVMEDRIKNVKGFVRPYNFDGMPAGNYSVTITDASGKTNLAVAYNNTVVNAVRKAEVTALENNKYQLRLIGNNADEVSVNIYDRNNELIHTEVFTQKGSFTRVYNMGKLAASDLTFEVIAAGAIVNRVQL
ncbi:MAG: hypothetical protein MUD08_01815 [Cytophagales bacterium]|jgi:hypothetical protein|nr:hypothetical protein [Cytophagales bacterium]